MKSLNVLLLASLISLTATAGAEQIKNPLSVHILNQQTGLPSAGVTVTLEHKEGDKWVNLSSAVTDADGGSLHYIRHIKQWRLATIK